MRGATMIVGALLILVGRAAPASAQESPLPSEVREWMELEQVQRWARLIQVGDSIFNNRSCARACHGEGGEGGQRAPNLTDDEWVQSDGSLEGIRRTIFWGVRREDFADPNRPFEMNPGGGLQLEWDQYQALAAYVWSLSNGTFLPGRGGG